MGYGFTDHLNITLGNINTYSVTAILHNSQITTSPTKPFPGCCFFTSCSLATTSNSGDSLASRAQVLLSQMPVQNSTVNWTAAPSLLSLPCRAQLHWFPQFSSSYLLGADCADNTPFPPLPRERVYRAVAQERVWYNRPSHDRSIEKAIHATLWMPEV
jgi:hypothetical protein